ncbi:MAG: N-acetylmuramoyl-L-alanine amidase, partial [Desulfovibrio sp.]|nr:N-acetylmuramoyl-L-alanine amidase [Desulfovibrio sp.]
PLADDALLASAKILTGQLGDERTARRLLTDLLRRYPKGDKRKEARELLALLTEGGESIKPIELNLVSWDTLDKNTVRISLELTGKPTYSAKLVEKTKGKGKSLFLDLHNTSVSNDIAKGARIKGSLLESIGVENAAQKKAMLRFDLKEAGQYSIEQAQNGRKLIVTVMAKPQAQPKEDTGQRVANAGRADPSEKTANERRAVLPARQDVGIAQQLGLSLHTVYIDAGHGGKDPGTYHNNIVEKLVAMDVAKTLGRLLENNGIEVVLSRANDSFLSLSQRTKKANEEGCDLFISIHVNASESKDVNGFETYYLDLARSPDAARVAALENAGSDRRLKDMQRVLADIMLTAKVSESQSLARDIQRVTLSRLKRNGNAAKNNGIKSAPFHVLIGAQMPAVLVELGYCTNPEEAKRLASARYRELLAQGLAEGILAYRARLTQQQRVENALTPQKSGAM